MSVLNLYQIITIILVIAFMTALFIFIRYLRIKNALGTKATGVSYYLYIWIAIKLFILMGCIYYLWEARFFNVWVLLSLIYACWSLIFFFFVLRRLQAWKFRARSEDQKNDVACQE
jgi:hypothetical protein